MVDLVSLLLSIIRMDMRHITHTVIVYMLKLDKKFLKDKTLQVLEVQVTQQATMFILKLEKMERQLIHTAIFTNNNKRAVTLL